MTELLKILLEQLLIPEIAVAIRAHYNATGKMPTDQQVMDALALDADAILAKGKAWQDAHPPKP